MALYNAVQTKSKTRLSAVFSKGKSFDTITDEQAAFVEHWINLCHAKSPITTALILFLSCPV